MEEFMLILCYVLFICLERTQWISNGYGYPSGLDMDTIFRPWIFSWAGKDCLHNMGMDLILFNPIQTRPIAILRLRGVHVEYEL